LLLVVMSVIGAILFALCGIWASHCPHCAKYLTYKRNWVGKYCKHCGKKIERWTS